MSPLRKILVATLVVAIVFALAGSKPVSAQSGTVTHTVRQGETLYSISRIYGVSVSCWGLADPNRIYPGQVLTCSSVGSATQYYQESAQPFYQQNVPVSVTDSYSNQCPLSGISAGLGRCDWNKAQGRWYIYRWSSTYSRCLYHPDDGSECPGIDPSKGNTQQGTQPQPVQQVAGVDWDRAVTKVENRVFETKEAAAQWLASVYNGASSAYKVFLETNGVNILIGTASLGGAIWLVKAAAGLSQGPLLTAAVVAFGVMVIFAIVEYVVAYICR